MSKTNAGVELGARLAVNQENITTFNSCTTVHLCIGVTIRQGWFGQTSDEAELSYSGLGWGESTDIDGVRSRADDVIMRLNVWISLVSSRSPMSWLTMVLVLIVITAILFATLDVTVAVPINGHQDDSRRQENATDLAQNSVEWISTNLAVVFH